MHIGIDFDNTIVCYDELFHREAVARGLIPRGVEPTKTAVRDHLRDTGREDAWTELQGFVYGDGIGGASLFPGVKDFLAAMRERRARVSVISHKTRFPVLGPRTDLHEAARRWLVQNELLDRDGMSLSAEHVFFNETKGETLRRIAELGSTHFIDDLPAFLIEPAFPAHVERILFDPHGCTAPIDGVHRASSWQQILAMIS